MLKNKIQILQKTENAQVFGLFFVTRILSVFNSAKTDLLQEQLKISAVIPAIKLS